jgi:hypothetical protein
MVKRKPLDRVRDAVRVRPETDGVPSPSSEGCRF